MKRKVSPIGDVVRSVVSRLAAQKSIGKEAVDASWKESVGEEGFKHSRPVAVRQKVLTVRVDSSAWLEELALKKRRILKAMKQRIGRDKLTEIRFRIGEWQ